MRTWRHNNETRQAGANHPKWLPAAGIQRLAWDLYWEPLRAPRCNSRTGGRPLEESELVEQARRGNADAYEALVRRYQEIAFRAAFVITGSAAEAEDAAQDAFMMACP